MKKQYLSSSKDVAETPGYDVQLLLSVLFLVGIGLIMVYSASGALATQKFHSDYHFLKRQSIFVLLSLLALVVCRYVPYRLYRVFAYPFLVISLLLLTAVHIPGLGNKAGGAYRWIELGFFTFQPSELARLALIIYMAYSLEKKQDLVHRFTIGMVPHLVILSLFSIVLLTQPDFGSVVIFSALTYIMMFVGGVKIRYLGGTLILTLLIGYKLMLDAPYRRFRWEVLLDPWKYETGMGYQTVHSLMAFGTGGFFGAGLGKGYQKLFYLPEPHTDFIFSVIGEELGMIGVVIIILLYAVILHRGINIAGNANDLFGSFLAIGITAAMGIQVCINMGVALGMLPTKGLTLPFLSYGGSSLLLNMAAMGILMNIAADKGKRKQE